MEGDTGEAQMGDSADKGQDKASLLQVGTCVYIEAFITRLPLLAVHSFGRCCAAEGHQPAESPGWSLGLHRHGAHL